MPFIGKELYADAAAAFPESEATMLLDDGVTSIVCLCPGCELQRQASDFGQSEIPSCTVTVLKSNEPESGLQNGKVVSLTGANGESYKLRVLSRNVMSGVLTLTMESVNG